MNKKSKLKHLKKGFISTMNNFKLNIVCMIFLTFSIISAKDINGLIEKHFNMPESEFDISKMTMMIVENDGSKRERVLKLATKKVDNGRDTYIEVLSPAGIKGIKLLSNFIKGKSDQQRIYLPAMGKTRRITSSGKNGKFLGSDIFFYDLESHTIDQYKYEYIGEGVFNGNKCTKVKVIPKDESAPYSSMVWWIFPDNGFVYKQECYDPENKNKIVKIIKMHSTVEKNGIVYVEKMIIENIKLKRKTLLLRNSIEVNVESKTDYFSVKVLR